MLLSVTEVGAKDLGVLTRVLYAIDLGEFLTNICRLANPEFLKGSIGPLGGVHDYQLHIKGEVLAGLDRQEAETVLKAAADRARADTRKYLEPFKTGGGELASAPLAKWCAEAAEPVVRRVISAHETSHAAIDRLLEHAKR